MTNEPLRTRWREMTEAQK